MKQIFLVENDEGIQTAWISQQLAEEQMEKSNEEIAEINEEVPADDAIVDEYRVTTYAIQDSTVLPYIIVYTLQGKIMKCAPRINLEHAKNEIVRDIAVNINNMNVTDEAYIIDSQEQIVYEPLKSVFYDRFIRSSRPEQLPKSNLRAMTSDGSV